MLRLNHQRALPPGKAQRIQIQPMLRLNIVGKKTVAERRRRIQIQPMLRLNTATKL